MSGATHGRAGGARPLHALGAVELLAGYRSGALSPLDAAEAVFARIDRWAPHLNAFYALDRDGALAAAAASARRWRAGTPQGALDGVPVTIKENVATRGVPVPLGSAATELVPAPCDAPPAARLREAGAVILGKTTMPDYGMLSSGLSSFHPLTRNPWNLAMNPGGSSAGAAAAAAAGCGPLHLGTDIGGSLRLPAGWCGIVALKPSHGRVPIHPAYYGRVAGPMTRSVADAALMMSVLSAQPSTPAGLDGPPAEGFDGAPPDPAVAFDPTALPPQAIDWQALDLDPAPLRIGVLRGAGWGLAVDPQIAAAVDAAAQAFAVAGARVEDLAPFTTRRMIDGLDRFWRMRAWLDLSALPAGRQALVLPYIRAWAAPAARLSGAEVFDGFSQMQALREAAFAATRGFDFVLSPTSPVPTFAAEAASPLDDPQRPFEHIAFTLPFNMSGQPAASIDCGRGADGLPIGLQIAGRRFDDLGVLRLARLWERLRGDLSAWPEPPG